MLSFERGKPNTQFDALFTSFKKKKRNNRTKDFNTTIRGTYSLISFLQKKAGSFLVIGKYVYAYRKH